MPTQPLPVRLLVLIVSAAFLSACSVSMTQQPVSSVPNETLALAHAAASSGSPAKAAELYEKILVAEPDNVEALQGAGLAYSRLGQNQRAESVLIRAAELQPGNIEIRNTLGRVHLALGAREEALEDFRKALGIDGRNVSALTGQGVTFDSMSRHAEAQDVYVRALKYYPTNFILRSNYALSLAISGQVDRGISILQELVRDPGAAEVARGNLALAYGLAGREADARTTLMLDLTPAQIADNLRAYAGLRRMISNGQPVGGLVFG